MGFRKPDVPSPGSRGIARGTVFSSVEQVVDDITLAHRDEDVGKVYDGPEEVEMSSFADKNGWRDDIVEGRDLEAGVPVASSSRMKLEDELITTER